uniref:Uncharacterized protein n=2 Tax=Timema TaxID=61471 RepID=A0A7R9D611_TIMPO|nr:unnamed protein product [Timema douglasi]CAD7408794.1 unnamed protein product [Timema poppensis]
MSLPQYQIYIVGGQHSQDITRLANMKSVLVWIVCLVVAVTLVTPGGSAPASEGEHYTDKFDQMDIEPIMNNARALKAFLKCLIKGESCTPEGETLKTAARTVPGLEEQMGADVGKVGNPQTAESGVPPNLTRSLPT